MDRNFSWSLVHLPSLPRLARLRFTFPRKNTSESLERRSFNQSRRVLPPSLPPTSTSPSLPPFPLSLPPSRLVYDGVQHSVRQESWRREASTRYGYVQFSSTRRRAPEKQRRREEGKNEAHLSLPFLPLQTTPPRLDSARSSLDCRR